MVFLLFPCSCRAGERLHVHHQSKARFVSVMKLAFISDPWCDEGPHTRSVAEWHHEHRPAQPLVFWCLDSGGVCLSVCLGFCIDCSLSYSFPFLLSPLLLFSLPFPFRSSRLLLFFRRPALPNSCDRQTFTFISLSCSRATVSTAPNSHYNTNLIQQLV